MKDQCFLAARGSMPAVLSWLATSLAILFILLLAGCASSSSSTGEAAPSAALGRDLYMVKKGDTLHSIAADHGLDFRNLVIWNSIQNPNHILVGQVLRTRPPGSSSGSDATELRPIATGSSVEQRNLGDSGGSLKTEPTVGKATYSAQTLARARAQAAQTTPTSASRAPVAAASAASAGSAPAAADSADSADSNWIWPASGKLVGTFSEGGVKGIDIAGNAGDPVLAASGGKVVYSGTGLRGYGKLVIVKHSSTYLTAYAHNQSLLVKEGQTVVKGQKIAEMGNTDSDQVKLHFEVRRQGKPVDPLKHLPPR